MFINLCGLDIEYCVQGEGDIPVILLHGWGSSFAVYSGIIRALSDRCRFYALNFPGCGNSQIMPSPWTLDDYCGLVKEFAKAFNIESPVIIGHSHGGRTALKLAAEKIIEPSKLVLLDSAGIIPKKSFKQKFRAKSFKAIKRVLLSPPFKNRSKALLDKARAHYGSADYNAAKPVLRQTMVSLVNTDLTDIIPKIDCPTLLIWGENDTDTPLYCGKKIESLIKDSGLCVIKNTGHFSFCEKPYEAAAILRSFIK